MKLKSKLFLEGTIEVKTGIRIGGSDSSVEIGGLDLSVIKTGNGIPFLPGSSIKGKIKSLLRNVVGENKLLKILFGDSSTKNEKFVTRIQILDAHLDQQKFKETFDNNKLDWEYTEQKSENTIGKDGKATHPRHIERVPAGAVFNFEIRISSYQVSESEADDTHKFVKLIYDGIDLLNDDYLGGSGSRGYGSVDMKITKISGKSYSEEGIEEMSEEQLSAFK